MYKRQTIAATAGVNEQQINDSHSFAALLSDPAGAERTFQFIDGLDGQSGAMAVGDGRYKLIELSPNQRTFYDLMLDRFEQNDLFQQGTVPASRLESLEQFLLELGR